MTVLQLSDDGLFTQSSATNRKEGYPAEPAKAKAKPICACCNNSALPRPRVDDARPRSANHPCQLSHHLQYPPFCSKRAVRCWVTRPQLHQQESKAAEAGEAHTTKTTTAMVAYDGLSSVAFGTLGSFLASVQKQRLYLSQCHQVRTLALRPRSAAVVTTTSRISEQYPPIKTRSRGEEKHQS